MKEIITLINLKYRCNKISDYTVFHTLQEIGKTSLKNGYTVLCLSPQHNLYINSLTDEPPVKPLEVKMKRKII